MFHYITATLPAKADLKAAEAIFKKYTFAFSEIGNEHVAGQLPPGEHQILTTAKCDCGTALGSCRVEKPPVVSKKELDQLRRKGWSEAKINRWLEEKNAAGEKDQRAARPELAETNDELVRWFSLMNAVFESGAADRVGVLLHEYSKAVASEKIVLSATETYSLTESTPLVLGEMREDVHYVFRR